MILLKTVVLFVLVNLAEFYPYFPKDVEGKPCGKCSRYAFKVTEYPKHPPPLTKCLKEHNAQYKCGQANKNGLSDMKNNNVTETNAKVIGGSDAKPNEFPWQVGLAFGYGGEITCGGSIISSQSILTAAHCVVDVSNTVLKDCIYAVVGEHDKSKPDTGEQWNRICDVKKHPDYLKTGNNEYDFAVLLMCNELLFEQKVSHVCLPPPGIQGNAYGGYKVEATGWGFTSYEGTLSDKLQKVQLNTMSNKDCFEVQQNSFWPFISMHESKICAYGAERGTCDGDSGGPLVKEEKNPNFYTIIGVTSYGHDECVKNKFPTVFARVTAVMTWLNGNVPNTNIPIIEGERGQHPVPPPPAVVSGAAQCPPDSKSIDLRKNTKSSRSLKNTGGVTYYHFEKDKKLSRKKAQETCISKYGGQLTSINTQDEYDWIKEQVIDLKMFGPIAIGGQWKDKSSRKFEWTDESEMDMSVLNANWFRTRNYQFPSYKNKKRINLELWYSRRAMGFANALDHKAPTMYICKVAESCTSCSSCSA